ncbi:MAG: thiamine phosphate synthase [Chloroflexota bacterium]|nr:thiamine phosphate synthase [Chloroflexota bacterium]
MVRPVLPLPVVMLVTDRRACGERMLDEVVWAAVDGGVNVVQLREKDLPGADLYLLATKLRAAVGTRALLLVNERIDVALAAGADGVQLGSTGLPCEVARGLLPDKLLGRSVHATAQAADAVAKGADLLVVGTMFASRSHPGTPPAGPTLLRKIANVTPTPLIGIGGISASNAAQVIGAGASGVAIISEIVAALDPREAAARLVGVVQEAWPTAPLHRRH